MDRDADKEQWLAEFNEAMKSRETAEAYFAKNVALKREEERRRAQAVDNQRYRGGVSAGRRWPVANETAARDAAQADLLRQSREAVDGDGIELLSAGPDGLAPARNVVGQPIERGKPEPLRGGGATPPSTKYGVPIVDQSGRPTHSPPAHRGRPVSYWLNRG